jgi:2-dehydropantoate 2-reductase
MLDIENVYLCGLGAIGASLGSVIHATDADCLRVIADRVRAGRYTRDGVLINGEVVPFRYVQPTDREPPADLLVFAVKRHQLDQAIRDAQPFVNEHTIVLSLLNGIDSEEVIGRALGVGDLLRSFVVETDANREGNSVRFTRLGTVVFGEGTGNTTSARLCAVQRLFERHHVPYRVSAQIERELWWKFMMNVGINQASAVLRAPYGTFQRVDAARTVMRAACDEVVQISQRAGICLTEAVVAECFRIVARLPPDGKTSMLQDVEAKRPTEVASFGETAVELGHRHGVPTPVNRLLSTMIRAIEQSYG